MDTSIIESNVRMIPIDMPYVRTALLGIADALDELDERTRGEGALGEQMRDEESEREWEKLQAKGTPGPASTIPGCYCRECKWAAPEDGDYACCGPLENYLPGLLPLGFGCVFGEKEAADE